MTHPSFMRRSSMPRWAAVAVGAVEKHSHPHEVSGDIKLLSLKAFYSQRDGLPRAPRKLPQCCGLRADEAQALSKEKRSERELLAHRDSVRMPTGEGARMAELSERIGIILRRVSKFLQPENLSLIERAEMKECLLALEQMKMLMSELELLHLFPE
jgi:hypothetical protein